MSNSWSFDHQTLDKGCMEKQVAHVDGWGDMGTLPLAWEVG